MLLGSSGLGSYVGMAV